MQNVSKTFSCFSDCTPLVFGTVERPGAARYAGRIHWPVAADWASFGRYGLNASLALLAPGAGVPADCSAAVQALRRKYGLPSAALRARIAALARRTAEASAREVSGRRLRALSLLRPHRSARARARADGRAGAAPQGSLPDAAASVVCRGFPRLLPTDTAPHPAGEGRARGRGGRRARWTGARRRRRR